MTLKAPGVPGLSLSLISVRGRPFHPNRAPVSALISWSRRAAQPFALWHVPARRLHDGRSGACALQAFHFPFRQFLPTAPAGRLGKQIARLACGPGGLSQWDASGSELGRKVAVDFESDADFHECGS
jgi:hypothetical protein